MRLVAFERYERVDFVTLPEMTKYLTYPAAARNSVISEVDTLKISQAGNFDGDLFLLSSALIRGRLCDLWSLQAVVAV